MAAAKSPVRVEARAPQSNVPSFTKEEEFSAYGDMLLIRRFEEKAGQMYGMGPDRGVLPPLHRPGGRRGGHEDGAARR